MDSRGFFSSFAFEYLEADRSRYAGYTAADFRESFRADDILFESFIDFMDRYNFRLDYYRYQELIKRYLKANLAEQLYSPDLKAEILGEADPVIQRVLDLDQPMVGREKT